MSWRGCIVGGCVVVVVMVRGWEEKLVRAEKNWRTGRGVIRSRSCTHRTILGPDAFLPLSPSSSSLYHDARIFQINQFSRPAWAHISVWLRVSRRTAVRAICILSQLTASSGGLEKQTGWSSLLLLLTGLPRNHAAVVGHYRLGIQFPISISKATPVAGGVQ